MRHQQEANNTNREKKDSGTAGCLLASIVFLFVYVLSTGPVTALAIYAAKNWGVRSGLLHEVL